VAIAAIKLTSFGAGLSIFRSEPADDHPGRAICAGVRSGALLAISQYITMFLK
jgi:hypothetical protein